MESLRGLLLRMCLVALRNQIGYIERQEAKKMAILHVRNVPQNLYKRIQSLAKVRNRSLSSEVIILLQDALRQERMRRSQAQSRNVE